MPKERKSYHISAHSVDRVCLRHKLDRAESRWFMGLDLLESRACTHLEAMRFVQGQIQFKRYTQYRIGKYGVYAIRDRVVCTYMLNMKYGKCLPLNSLLSTNIVAVS